MATTIDYDTDDDSALAEAPAASLAEITRLALQQKELEAQIEAHAIAGGRLAEALAKIQTIALPEAMASVRLESFTLEDGSMVKIAKGLSVSVPRDSKTAVCDYLEEHEAGDLVAIDVTLEFGRGKEQAAADLFNELRDRNLFPTMVRDVNTARLRAWMTEQMEKGVEVDLKLLGGYEWKKSKIEVPKPKAPRRK